jgi:hypothetical protein
VRRLSYCFGVGRSVGRSLLCRSSVCSVEGERAGLICGNGGGITVCPGGMECRCDTENNELNDDCDEHDDDDGDESDDCDDEDEDERVEGEDRWLCPCGVLSISGCDVCCGRMLRLRERYDSWDRSEGRKVCYIRLAADELAESVDTPSGVSSPETACATPTTPRATVDFGYVFDDGSRQSWSLLRSRRAAISGHCWMQHKRNLMSARQLQKRLARAQPLRRQHRHRANHLQRRQALVAAVAERVDFCE